MVPQILKPKNYKIKIGQFRKHLFQFRKGFRNYINNLSLFFKKKIIYISKKQQNSIIVKLSKMLLWIHVFYFWIRVKIINIFFLVRSLLLFINKPLKERPVHLRTLTMNLTITKNEILITISWKEIWHMKDI